MSNNNNDVLLNAFIEEAEELLVDLESDILDLETDPENKENLDSLFRVMHTIKGSAGMVGMTITSKFAHKVEDTLDDIRKGVASFTPTVADTVLLARDVILTLLRGNEEVDTELKEQMDAIIAELGEGNGGLVNNKKETTNLQETQVPPPDEWGHTYNLVFKPDENIFMRGINPLSLLDDLNDLGLVSVVVNMEELPPLLDFKYEKSYLSWKIYLSTESSAEEIKQVFRYVEDPKNIIIEEMDFARIGEGEVARVGDILLQGGLISQEQLDDALGSQKKVGEVLIENKAISKQDIDQALTQQKHLQKVQTKKLSKSLDSVRVSSEKLDKFVDLAGELVTLSARLDQISHEMDNVEIRTISESLTRLMEELRDSALGIRMIPVGDSFNSFRRLIRDLSKDLDKEVYLETEGTETELDKTIIDRLHDPLMHVIRNSLDHGLESKDERIKNGKEPVGIIKLKARHAGGNVVISIEDDGKGLARDKIGRKAIERGLISSYQSLRDEEVFKFIFQSGFSTATIVSNVSGRGVGMDVVKKEIDSLGGHVAIESEEGKFTRISFTIPLTMAIIGGLLVSIEDDAYIIPLTTVESCLEMDQVEIQKSNSNNDSDIIYYRNEFLPFIRLRDFLRYPKPDGVKEQLVVIRTEDNLFGLVVDEVIGDHQTVIKPLGKLFKHVRGFSGASILGSGQVALILNIGIIERMHKEETHGTTV